MRNVYLFVIFLVMYEFSTYISNDMIMPGMLNIVAEFHASVEFVSLSFTVFILGNSLLQLFLGPLSENYGKRNIILIGNGLFIIFTIFLAMSQNIYVFMLGRLLQGSGLAFIAVGYALIHERFNDSQSVKIFSLMANVSLFAPLVGPVLGAMIIQIFGWRYIFVITGLFASISFIGLYLFTPKCTVEPIKLSIQNIGKTYFKILLTPQFIIGTICISLSTLPIMCWIGLAPTIIMKTMKLSMTSYAIYQLMALGGLSLSTIVMHIAAGRVNFYRLVKIGSSLVFVGLMLSVIFNRNLNTVVLGLFFYSFGLGIFNTLIMRLVITLPDLPQSMLTSLMVFIQTTVFAFGIEITNRICYYFGYSLFGFTLISFIMACVFIILAAMYANIIRHRTWS